MNDLKQHEYLARVTLPGPLHLRDREVLTPAATGFLARLHAGFEDRRRKLIARRSVVQRQIDIGVMPDFPDRGSATRQDLWRVRSLPAMLADRRTGLVVPAADTGLLIDALNTGAAAVVADFGDSLVPAWTALLEGQRNVRNGIHGELACIGPDGRRHTAGAAGSTIAVRPRGWHLVERHLSVDGEAMSASLFDAGLYLFHNASPLLDRGAVPHLCLPRLENRFEAAFWDDLLRWIEDALDLPSNSVRSTVMLESVLAAFELDEILYELRDRAACVEFGRSEYLFSYIARFRRHPGYVLPAMDRTAEFGFLDAALTVAVQTCHRRGVPVVGGGLGLDPPDRADRGAWKEAAAALAAWSGREARAGCDGTRVSHPAFLESARSAFDEAFPSVNRMAEMRLDAVVRREDLLRAPDGTVSPESVTVELESAIGYIESWLSGAGRIPLRGVLADASDAEVSRALLWQWLHHAVALDGVSPLTPARFRGCFNEAVDRLARRVGPERYRRGQFELASRLVFNSVHEPEMSPSLTVRASQYL